MTPTSEQSLICANVGGPNMTIRAYAGTGKSATLKMLNALFSKDPTLYIVFNTEAAEKARKEFPSTTLVKTFNGLGHSVFMKTKAKVSLNPKKVQDFLSEYVKEFKGDDRKEIGESFWDIVTAVKLAKNLGYIPNGKFSPAQSLISREAFHAKLETKPSCLVATSIDALLCMSIQAAYKGAIDYDDQIYMPTMFGGTFPRFPRVLVDETQDANPVNIEMLKKLRKCWMASVGDPAQSIYAFRGAAHGAMDQISNHFQMQTYDLSISFRCPEAIVKAARWRVPNYKWKKAGGVYQKLKELSYAEIQEGSAIICRNNAPLFRLAFGLIKSGRGVKVTGSDIGPRIVRLLRKLASPHANKEEALSCIAEWEKKKLEDSQAQASVIDTAECMRIFVSFGQTLSHAIAYADHLFKQEGNITLITGHKAKGREWNVVYHLDPWLLGNDEQEQNLRYVIQTRAAEKAYEISSRDIDCLRKD